MVHQLPQGRTPNCCSSSSKTHRCVRQNDQLAYSQARKGFKLKQLFIHCPGPDYDCTNSANDGDYKDNEDDEDHVDATTISEDEGSEDDSGMSTGSHDSDYEGVLKPAERL